jgi:transposase
MEYPETKSRQAIRRKKMSLPRRGIEPVPEETAIIAQAAFPKGNPYLPMRDEWGSLYTDDMFADLYPLDGQPAVRPWRLALVTVMQFAENLTDRQAADAVRDRIVWKYVLSLAMTDAGFDFSVLSEFRQRLVEHEAGERLLDEMLQHFKAKGLLKARGRQRTDSTHILAAVRNLNQLELVHETLRHTLNELALAAPAWLKSWVPCEWFDHYSERTSNYLLPKAEIERQQWADRVGQDGLELLAQVYHTAAAHWLAQLPAIEILRQVWVQNYYQDNGKVHLRDPKNQPPSAQRITSPYDLDARYSTKRDTTWVGYKVHLTETCEPDTPNLITQVETRPSTESDNAPVETIHRDLAEKGCLPDEHIVDPGYMSVELLIKARQDYDIDLLGPVPDDNSWQSREGGYDSSRFTIDWDQQRVTCPQGKQSCSWSLAQARGHRPVVKIKFRQADCAECPVRSCCTRTTKAKRRTLTILAPQAHFEAQQSARHRQTTTDFKERYATRAGVEGTISHAAFTLGARRSRYRGMAKTHLQHLATATAMNLMRVMAWLNETPRSTTPQSHFARLAA